MNDWIGPLLAGAATGILSGFGAGGGTLLLVYMTAFAGVEQRAARGINLIYFIPAAPGAAADLFWCPCWCGCAD